MVASLGMDSIKDTNFEIAKNRPKSQLLSYYHVGFLTLGLCVLSVTCYGNTDPAGLLGQRENQVPGYYPNNGQSSTPALWTFIFNR